MQRKGRCNPPLELLRSWSLTVLRIAIYAEDAGGNDDGEIIGLKLDKYYNASTLH